MDEKNINEFVTAYVDNELRGEELQGFEALLASDPRVKQLVDQEVSIKKFIRSNIKKVNAPDQLRVKVEAALAQEKNRIGNLPDQTNVESDYKSLSESTQSPGAGKSPYRRIFFLAAAVVIFAILLWSAQYNTVPEVVTDDAVAVEYMTFVHYQNFSGSALPPSFESESTYDAQAILKERYGCNVTIPELAGATFAGVVYADFHDGFHTPLLSYRVSDDDYIYVFAFEMKDLNNNPLLDRHPDAVNAIVAHNDVFIMNYDGMHVVSWKWDDVWYSAVSKHDGEILAAMLPH